MNISIICIPYQIDVSRWGVALGPQAFLDHGLIQLLEAKGHTVSNPTWIELPKSERTRDSITNLGNIAKRSSAAVSAALKQEDSFILVLEGDCTHAIGAIGGLAQAKGSPGVVWFDAHGNLTPAPHWPPRQHIIEAARVTAQTVPVKVASLAVYNPAGDVKERGANFGLDMAMAIVEGVAK